MLYRICIAGMTVAMLLSCTGLTASAEELASGTCGDAITWRYEGETKYEGTLYIEGTGDMYDYDAYDDTGEGPFFVETQQTPWGEYAGYIDKVVFSDGITSIGNFAFSHLASVEEIVFSDSITEIGDYAFAFSSISSTEYLRISKFPSNLETIGEGAFLSCNFAEENLILPEGLTTIRDVAFSDMISIEDADESNWFRSQPLSAITIPNSVTSIGEHAFGATVSATVLANGEDMDYSETLTEASASMYRKERPTAVYFTDIADFPVYGYTGSISETYAADHGFTFVALDAEQAFGTCGENLIWTVENGTLTISGTGNMDDYDNYDCEFVGMQPVETLDRPWGRYSDTITSIVIEEGVTGIGNFAFSDLYYVETVNWADSLTHIGDYAFLSVNAGDTVKQFDALPSNLESIGDGAFFGQDYFAENLELPQNLQSVGMAAFAAQKEQRWQSVTIPKSVVTIGEYAFGGTPASYEGDSEEGGWEYLDAFFDAIFYKEQPVSNFFTGIDGFTVYGNANTAAQTYAETHDFTFKALDANLTTGVCCENVTWKIEGDTLTISGEGVLEGLSGNLLEMTEEEFPQWWTEVRNALEESGTTLKHLVIEEGITEIGDTAFPVDTFETITFPNSLTKIGEYTFGYFLDVSGELVLSENVTEIGDAAFVCCPYSNITILNPDAVIGECAIGCSLDHRPESGPVLIENFTITGYVDSTAQLYAEEYGIPFIALKEPDDDTTNASPETTVSETTTSVITSVASDKNATTSTTTISEVTTTTVKKNNTTSSPKTSDAGIMALVLVSVTALLGGAVCRKKN